MKIDLIVPTGTVLSTNMVGSASAICPAVASPAKKATAPPIILLLLFTSSFLADKIVANLGEACGANASAPALIVANNAITFMLKSRMPKWINARRVKIKLSVRYDAGSWF